MNQFSTIPALGLTLAIPRDRAHNLLEQQIAKGTDLVRNKVSTEEAMEELKRSNWQWVLDTCAVLKEVFANESVALYFSSSVYFEVSVKLNDFERDLDEFPSIVRGRVDRLRAFQKTLPIIPEPPNGDFILAQFHPRIYFKTWRPFELAQYGPAIAAAVQELEDAVKQAVTGNLAEVGANLMRVAFHPEEGLLHDPEATLHENTGVSELFSGFMERYRNLPANSVFDIRETARILALASFLMYQVDLRTPKSEEEKIEFELLKDEDPPVY